MVSPIAIVGYLALFVFVGAAFLAANLFLGRWLRPDAPNPEKLEVYECGEPTIGSSFVQFDLRFYVVALLFIIFDVEIAFFFPWATVFGKATQLMDPNFASYAAVQAEQDLVLNGDPAGWSDANRATHELAASDHYDRQLRAKLMELGFSEQAASAPQGESLAARQQNVEQAATNLARLSMLDIAVFFAVLMVGFAYVWKRGDLDWVRAVSQERATAVPRGPAIFSPDRETVLSA